MKLILDSVAIATSRPASFFYAPPRWSPLGNLAAVWGALHAAPRLRSWNWLELMR